MNYKENVLNIFKVVTLMSEMYVKESTFDVHLFVLVYYVPE